MHFFIKSILLFFIIITAGCSDSEIMKIKNGTMKIYPQAKIGDVFSAHFDNEKWSIEKKDGKLFVIFNGEINSNLHSKIIKSINFENYITSGYDSCVKGYGDEIKKHRESYFRDVKNELEVANNNRITFGNEYKNKKLMLHEKENEIKEKYITIRNELIANNNIHVSKKKAELAKDYDDFKNINDDKLLKIENELKEIEKNRNNDLKSLKYNYEQNNNKINKSDTVNSVAKSNDLTIEYSEKQNMINNVSSERITILENEKNRLVSSIDSKPSKEYLLSRGDFDSQDIKDLYKKSFDDEKNEIDELVKDFNFKNEDLYKKTTSDTDEMTMINNKIKQMEYDYTNKEKLVIFEKWKLIAQNECIAPVGASVQFKWIILPNSNEFELHSFDSNYFKNVDYLLKHLFL